MMYSYIYIYAPCIIHPAWPVCKQRICTKVIVIEFIHLTHVYAQDIVIGLFAGRLSITELRKFYFRARDDVFKDPTGGISFDTDGLEEMLKNAVGAEMRMSDVKYPR